MYRKFEIDKKVAASLPREEKKVLNILEDIVKETEKVYKQQLKDGFYPKGINKKEIEEAGKKNPGLLSPFTFVEKKDGRLQAVPYHQKYAAILEPIAEKIDLAAGASSHPKFKKYLHARAKSLRDGSYKDADGIWLQIKGYQLDFSIGPFERYLDKLLFLKRAYQAHVGIVDKEMSKTAEQIKEVLYSSAKLSFDKTHSTDIAQKGVQVVVEETPATSGYLADVVFSGEHFPSDLEVMQQYGSKVIIYSNQLKYKFEKLHYPIFKALFEKRFASKYDKKLLLKATGWSILLYELGRQLHKFIGARERLQELYGPIDEANGAVAGVQHAKSLVVKGLMSQDDLEAIIIIHIVWMFSDWLIYQENKSLENYVIGDAFVLNDYLKQGALREQQGISWPNFSRIFFELEALTDKLTYLLAEGTYKETKDFIEENGDLSNLKRLAKNLKSIKPLI